jgi:SRSO17 transposase
MDLLASDASRLRLEAYVKEVASVIGHADRVVPLHDYCTGLLLPGERKSVEPIEDQWNTRRPTRDFIQSREC